MVDDKIVGKYWLCKNGDGKRVLTQGIRPIRSGEYWIRRSDCYSDMGWIWLDSDSTSRKDGKMIESKDFKGLNFPEIRYEDEPLEIEICKSGKVYWYES